MSNLSTGPAPAAVGAEGPTRNRRWFLRSALSNAGALALLGSSPLTAHAAATKTANKTTKKKKKAKATTTSPATTTPTATKAASGTTAVPSGKELVVAFTFAPEDGGRASNPFVAVWIEDLQGAALRTLYLSFLPGKGLRWLPELRRWYQADQVRQITGGVDLLATVSSATRLPGAYTVAWAGLSDDGTPLAPGEYVLCVEAAREHGPYSLVKGKMNVTADMAALKLPDNSELTGVSAALKSKS